MAENFTSTRQKLLMRWGQMKTERASWWSHWQEISTYLLPWNGRYFRQDRDKGHRRANQIYDSTGTRALRILGAGLMAGATSPARPWFRLGTHDPDLNQAQPVKLWLSDVAQRMHAVFQKSNTYRALHQVYEEMGAFGTGASIVLPDFSTVIHHYPLTIGEYAIAADWQGRVNAAYREFEKTVAETVQEFGLSNCSMAVQSMYSAGQLGAWVPIIHAIEPRSDRDPSKRDAKNMEWASYYFELGGDTDKVLRESGFKQFPAVVPRWAVAGGDIYGNSPGMEALGDIKQLQHEQLRKAQGIDYQTNPPLQVPTTLKNRDVERLPGGITFVEPANGAKIETAFNVNLDLEHLLADIQDVRERINDSFFVDVFTMLANSDNPQMTATEVAERKEEKMLMMGPVLERLNNELLFPLIETTFTHMVEVGALPPAPQELAGMSLSVEFISMLAEAQRAIGVNSVDRFVGALGTVAGLGKQDVLDKFDADAWADDYSDRLGIDPQLIVASDKVAIIRQARAQAQAQQAKIAAAEQASNATKNFASAAATAPPGGAPANVIDQFSGYGG